MRKENREILTFAGFLFVLALAVCLVGAIGGDCVADCVESGGPDAVCFNTCRP